MAHAGPSRLARLTTVPMDDLLFEERLDVFLLKNLKDVRDFAAREGRPEDEVRRRVSEWHFKYLYDLNASLTSNKMGKLKANEILLSLSDELETLHKISGRHSFILSVDPADEADDGFLGGTAVGKDFWSSFRNGGVTGARLFKRHIQKAVGGELVDVRQVHFNDAERTLSGNRVTPAVALKNTLYNEMRAALRMASGNQNAEMKWSKPEKLVSYGVTLQGWPPNITFKNPSQMTSNEVSTVIKLLKEKTIIFVSTQNIASGSSGDLNSVQSNAPSEIAIVPAELETPPDQDQDSDLSWAYELGLAHLDDTGFEHSIRESEILMHHSSPERDLPRHSPLAEIPNSIHKPAASQTFANTSAESQASSSGIGNSAVAGSSPFVFVNGPSSRKRPRLESVPTEETRT